MDNEQKTEKTGLQLLITAKTINYCPKQFVKPKYSNLRLKHLVLPQKNQFVTVDYHLLASIST